VRILQVHNRYRVAGGEDEVVERERALLVRGGQQVTQVLVDNPTGALASARALAQSAWNVRAARRVVAQARRDRADVVHVHNTWFSLSPSVVHALSQAGFPVVMTLHNFRTTCLNGLLLREGRTCTLCVGTHPGPGIRHRCYRESAVLSAAAAAAVEMPRLRHVWQKDVAAFLVLDESAVPLLASGGIPQDRMVVRRNSSADPGPRANAPSRSDEVLYAGRLSEEKGVDVLLEAWPRLRQQGLTLLLCGDGPLLDQVVRAQVPGVRVLGRVDRATVQESMLSARALVFPSICHEAGPLAPIEAAAAGLPTIISSSVGVSRRLERSGAGWSVAPGDAADLAGALGRLADAAAVDDAGRAARLLYEEAHTDAVATASLIDVYQAAISGGIGRPTAER
jgi:glycosyltransferase involved in cell wall biosynthesis